MNDCNSPENPTCGITEYSKHVPVLQKGNEASLQVSMVSQINTDDLTDVMVAKVEAQIRGRLAELNGQLNKLQKEAKDLDRQGQKHLREWTRMQVNKDEIAKTFTQLHSSLAITNVEFDYPEAIYKETSGTFNAVVQIHFNQHLHSQNFQIPVSGDAPVEFVSLQQAAFELEPKIRDVKTEINRVRQALANASALKRQAKASMVEQLAQSDESAKAVMNELDRQVQQTDVDGMIDSLQSYA